MKSTEAENSVFAFKRKELVEARPAESIEQKWHYLKTPTNIIEPKKARNLVRFGL
ncbi:MAG: hypothetical protein KBT36_13510 [Kurthia sp.]|nr:hypothetical protein [Candidatus Kurthia equi]